MLSIKMKFRDYPMLGYFMNMFNASQPPSFNLFLFGPTTTEIPVELRFYSVDQEPDCEAIAKMCAAAYGADFSVTKPAVVDDPEHMEVHIDGTTF